MLNIKALAMLMLNKSGANSLILTFVVKESHQGSYKSSRGYLTFGTERMALPT